MLNVMHHFAASKDVRFYLVGVFYEHATRSLVATDGHILAYSPEGSFEIEGATGDLIIPLDMAKKYKPGTAVHMVDEWIEVAGQRMKPIDGKYPDWRRAVPGTTSGEAAHLDLELLSRIAKANKSAGAKYPGQVVIKQGGKGPSTFELANGVKGAIMPWDPKICAAKVARNA